MSKVGILSMQRIFNYGSFLQAYGLKKMLEELGCQVEFMDYHPGECLVPTKNKKGLLRKILKAWEIFHGGAPLKEKIRFIKYKKNYAVNYYPYLGIGKKMNYSPKLDLLVIGSDEVFNCIQDNTNVGFSPELFGAGNNSKKIISYAASFGNTTEQKLEQYQVKDKVAGWLKEFAAISVRDKNSGDVVVALTGKRPEYNLDPVLIYDFIEKCKDMFGNILESNYMILYGYSNRFTKQECQEIRAYADEKNLKIFCIGGVQHCCDKFIDCTPFQVIAYFQHANCVVTDTFHGTILSVITHQRFVSFVRSKGYGNSEKLADLLKRLHLEERMIEDLGKFSQMLIQEPDYARADRVILEERGRAYAYLKSQLS